MVEMALEVSTNDASALTDTDLDELASMEGAFSAEALSQAKEDWVHRWDTVCPLRSHER